MNSEVQIVRVEPFLTAAEIQSILSPQATLSIVLETETKQLKYLLSPAVEWWRNSTSRCARRGGGAGGYLDNSSVYVISQSYSVTVGGGERVVREGRHLSTELMEEIRFLEASPPSVVAVVVPVQQVEVRMLAMEVQEVERPEEVLGLAPARLVRVMMAEQIMHLLQRKVQWWWWCRHDWFGRYKCRWR